MWLFSDILPYTLSLSFDSFSKMTAIKLVHYLVALLMVVHLVRVDRASLSANITRQQTSAEPPNSDSSVLVIANGVKASQAEALSICSLQTYNGHRCTAAVIKEDTVITAAHCFYK